MKRDRRAAYRHGHAAELAASMALMLKGYRLLARRYRTPLGEIDLVVRRGRTICFVEVKARADRASALAAVDRASERRIAGAADLWLARHPAAASCDLRFDLVVVTPRRWPLHVRDAFRPGYMPVV